MILNSLLRHFAPEAYLLQGHFFDWSLCFLTFVYQVICATNAAESANTSLHNQTFLAPLL